MFGWRKVGDVVESKRRRFGISLEVFDTGLWLNVYFGKRWSAFTRYTANRHTGPEDNDAVLGFFHKGLELRKRYRAYRSGFEEAAAKPVLTRAEIERRNREQTIAKPLPSMWSGRSM